MIVIVNEDEEEENKTRGFLIFFSSVFVLIPLLYEKEKTLIRI